MSKEYGRIQFTVDPATGVATVHIENTQRSGHFWLPIGTPRSHHLPIGYLRLREIKPGSRLFELAEMRPADGPLPIPAASASGDAAPPPGGRE